jgi:purine-nucleoside phosphorylase
MSTVPEVIVARHAGMRILAIATITDMALGDRPEHVSEEEVLAVANRAGRRLADVVKGVVARL